MISTDEFKRVLNDTSLDLSRSELERIIDDELKKPEGEADFELIDLCFSILDDMESATPERAVVPTEKSEEASEENAGKTSKETTIKKHRISRLLLAAVIAALLIVGAITASAYIFDFDLFGGAVRVNEDGIKIDFNRDKTDDTDKVPYGADLPEALAEHGISPVKLPEVMLSNKCEITDITYKESELFDGVNIMYLLKKQSGNIYIEQYTTDYITPHNFYDTSSVSSTIDVNGMIVYILDNLNGSYTIVYQDGFTQYTIAVPLSLEQTIAFAETIK